MVVECGALLEAESRLRHATTMSEAALKHLAMYVTAQGEPVLSMMAALIPPGSHQLALR